jgi:hypothetical protein
MSESKSIQRVGRTVGFGILGAALILVLLTVTGDGQVDAASTQVWWPCDTQRVAAYPDRIHVRCANEIGSDDDLHINYVAAPTQDAAHAARLLSIMTTALVTGEDLWVLYDSNPDKVPRGCLVADCRLLVAVELW